MRNNTERNYFAPHPASRRKKAAAAVTAVLALGAGGAHLIGSGEEDKQENIACIVQVKDGDTLSGIANRFGESTDNIVDVVDPYTNESVPTGDRVRRLQPGDKVTLATPENSCQTHGGEDLGVVISGDPRDFAKILRELDEG